MLMGLDALCCVQARETIWHIIVHLVTCQSATPLGVSLRKVRLRLSNFLSNSNTMPLLLEQVGPAPSSANGS